MSKHYLNIQTLFHLCAHAVNRFIARKPEIHPKLFNGKKPFQNVTLQILPWYRLFAFYKTGNLF